MSKEIWKLSSLLEYKYEVSSKGRVRRAVHGHGTHVGKIRKLTVHTDGYVRLVVHVGSGNFLVHRLVMDAFVRPRPKGMEIDHKNLIRSDNCIENLQYRVPLENRSRGRSASGKTSASIVRKIRSSIERPYVLAKKYGVSAQTISAIRHRMIWRHV